MWLSWRHCTVLCCTYIRGDSVSHVLCRINRLPPSSDNVLRSSRPQICFWGAFREVAKSYEAFFKFVLQPAWNNSTLNGRIFMKFDIWGVFENLSGKFNFQYGLIRITGALLGDLCDYVIVSRSVLFRMKNVSDESFRENKNTHFMFNNPPPPENRGLWDNVEKHRTAGQATDHNIIRRIRIACWITKALDTR
jgi:hypothetical protein